MIKETSLISEKVVQEVELLGRIIIGLENFPVEQRAIVANNLARDLIIYAEQHKNA